MAVSKSWVGSLTSWYIFENLEDGFLPVMSVHQPADHGVKQDNKDCPQRRDKKPHLSPIWMSLCHPGGEISNEI